MHLGCVTLSNYHGDIGRRDERELGRKEGLKSRIAWLGAQASRSAVLWQARS